MLLECAPDLMRSFPAVISRLAFHSNRYTRRKADPWSAFLRVAGIPFSCCEVQLECIANSTGEIHAAAETRDHGILATNAAIGIAVLF